MGEDSRTLPLKRADTQVRPYKILMNAGRMPVPSMLKPNQTAQAKACDYQ